MSSCSATSQQGLTAALILLAAATTVVVASEFIVVGLLPLLARDMNVSIASAGHLIGAFALSASLLGPPLTLAVAAQPPRRVIIATLLLFAFTNLASVAWPIFTVIMAMRILQGAALPVFISVGAAVVTQLAAPERSGRALGLANTGFAAGVVIALPAGVALADNGAWAPSFVALAACAFIAAGFVAWLFPLLPGRSAAIPRPWRLLRTPTFPLHLLLSVAVFAAMFAAYTYLAAWLQQVAGLGPRGIALALTGFGAAGLLGNTAAAFVADRAPLRVTLAATVALTLAALGLSLTSAAGWHGLLLAVWGAAHTANVVLCQVRVTLAGRATPAFAMALNIAAANLGIALGALAGGIVVTRWGIDAIGWGPLALVLPVVALTTAIASQQATSNSPPGTGRR